MEIAYLEFVTGDPDGLRAMLEQLHETEFGDSVTVLGGARVAKSSTGGLLGVRAPLRDNEVNVVRPYMRVDDIHAAVAKALDAGVTVALPVMAIPDYAKIAIVIQSGIEYGLWQD